MKRVGSSRQLSSGASDSFAQEFAAAGDRDEIVSVAVRLAAAMDALNLTERERGFVEIGRAEKKNFAQRLSTAIAQKVADALRPRFRSILPDQEGRMQESRSMGAGGLKKLDVNYSTPEMGLGLGVSVKTINFRDESTRRYTKNIKRVDGELRAEAQDYHMRQPYAVLSGLIFMPADAALDGAGDRSSFRHAHEVFRNRAGRVSPDGDHAKFERLWLGLYGITAPHIGRVLFYDTMRDVPAFGAPEGGMNFAEVLVELTDAFDARNRK